MNDPEVAGESRDTQPDAPNNSGNAWGDRLRALKNVPPVLHFVWESGPAVVFWNITIRILVAFLPVGIGIIGRFIIDGVNRIRLHQPLPQHFIGPEQQRLSGGLAQLEHLRDFLVIHPLILVHEHPHPLALRQSHHVFHLSMESLRVKVRWMRPGHQNTS